MFRVQIPRALENNVVFSGLSRIYSGKILLQIRNLLSIYHLGAEHTEPVEGMRNQLKQIISNTIQYAMA